MTPFKQFSKSGATNWQKHIRRGGLFIAVAAILTQTNCGSNEPEWEEVSVQVPTKGIITTLEEAENGEFSVVDEQIVQTRDSSRVIVRKKDGTEQTLTLEQAKTLINPADTTSNHTAYQQHHSSGMGRAIWWGAMGYMMGRSFSTPVQPYVYRQDRNPGTTGSAGFYGGGRGFSQGNSISGELQRTSTMRTEMRPARARSGFFRGFGRSSGG